MASKSFNQRFAAVIALLAIFDGTRAWTGPRARKGLMNAPPGYGGSSGGALGGAAQSATPGLASNTASQPPSPNPQIQISSGTNIPYYLQSQRLTSAAALTPNVSGMFLVDVATEGGNNPGSFSINLGGNLGVAHFLAMASGTDATGLIGAERVIHYAVNYQINTTSLASGLVAFNATSATNMAVTLTYSTVSFGGPDISSYRACHAKGSETGTSGTSRTFTFDAAPAVGRAMIAVGQQLATATGIPQGNVAMPSFGAYTQQIPCQGPTSTPQLVPLQPMPAGPTLVTTFTATTLGGSTNYNLFALVFY